MKKILVFLLVVTATAGAIAQTKNPAVVDLSSERFKAIIENDKNGVVIDLRTEAEIVKTGMINGAVHIDWLAKDSEKEVLKLDKNKTYYIYCASGGRSSDAAEFMEKNGFTHIYTLKKGMTEWLAKGFPTMKK